MKNTKIEVEGGELLLMSKEGHYVVVPAKDRKEIKSLLDSGCDSCINSFIKTLPKDSEYAGDGTTVSELYTQKTGKAWSTAKSENLTDGSYASNMKLRDSLLAGNYSKPSIPVSQVTDNTLLDTPAVTINDNNSEMSISEAPDFNAAFKIARNTLGKNQIFEYKNRKYGTNLEGESFEPSDTVLQKFNLPLEDTKQRLEKQNELVKSIYVDKKTVKLESEFKNWDDVKKRNADVNKMSQADLIKNFYKGKDEQYLILDKTKNIVHLYQGDKEISSYPVGIGENKGDEQTKTVIGYFDNKGNRLTNNKDAFEGGKLKRGYKSKVMWNEGSKTTGAGIYTVSIYEPKNEHYSNAPSWNFKNEAGIEVPMAIHSSFGNRTAKIEGEGTYSYPGAKDGVLYKKNNNEWYINQGDATKNKFVKINDPSGKRSALLNKNAIRQDTRLSNGCINGLCRNLKELASTGYGLNKKLYVLPEDETNKYVVQNNLLVFKSKDPNVNRTVNTLNYLPIKIKLNKSKFVNDTYTTLDFNDDAEYKVTERFIKSMANNKQKIMKIAKIDGDLYNELTKVAFGIYGNETNFGDTHSGVGNLMRAGNKKLAEINRKYTKIPFLPTQASSPDYQRKAKGYSIFGKSISGETAGENNSVGLTQMRWNYIKTEPGLEKMMIEGGIKNQMDLINPEKAAIATMIRLAYLTNNRAAVDKNNVLKTLPQFWGGSSKDQHQTYTNNVIKNSKYINITELH